MREFFFADNPMDDDDLRILILSMGEPVVIGQVFHFLDESQWMECKSRFDFHSSIQYGEEELIVIGCIFIGALPEAWTTPQEQADRISKIMSEMGDWYYSFMQSEDSK